MDDSDVILGSWKSPSSVPVYTDPRGPLSQRLPINFSPILHSGPIDTEQDKFADFILDVDPLAIIATEKPRSSHATATLALKPSKASNSATEQKSKF